MKKIFALIIFLFVSFFIGCLWWLWGTSPLCHENCQPKIVIIEKGDRLSEVAGQLAEEKIIRSALAFQVLALKEGFSRKIQAGNFRISPGMTSFEIARELTHGTLDLWVTIIEGWRKEEIADKLKTSGLEKLNIEEFLKETKDLEGKLFPDTYRIPQDATAKKIVEMMTQNFVKKTPVLTKETLILASIVEREAKNEPDRSIIAGILLKRLRNNWLLQADATVQYAVGSKKCQGRSDPLVGEAGRCEWWPKSLSREDLKIKSSYNTYLFSGLPPGPIASPGLAAIKAVQEPTQTDYWFYLSDSEGKMHYAKTDEEHVENIKKYL